MAIKINKLSLSISKNNFKQDKKGLSRIILTQNFFNKDTRLPEIFALIEFNAMEHIPNEEILALLDKLETKITERIQKIYNSINERKSFQTDNLSEKLLELILKSLNGEIKFILESKEYMEMLIENLNLFIGILEPFVVKNEQKYYLHFSHYNRVNGLLVYRAGDKFKLMSIFNQENNEEDKEGKKIFSNIISGQLDSDCFLIIANQNVLDYIIPDKIKQLVISMDIMEAISNLKKMLTEIDASGAILDFAAILIYLNDTGAKRNLTPENSIEQLIKTGKNTERFLTPSILPEFNLDFGKFGLFIKEKIKNAYLSLLKFRGKIFYLKISHKNKNDGRNDIKSEELRVKNFDAETAPPQVKKSFPIFKDSKKKFLRFGSLFFDLFKKILFFIPIKLFLIFKKVKDTSRLVKIIILILVSSAGMSYYWLTKENTKKVENTNDTTYQQSLTEINEKLSALETYIIYENLESANNVITEINGILDNKMPKGTAERDKKYNEIKKSIYEKEKKINKVAEIGDPEKIDLRNNGQIKNIIVNDGKIITFAFDRKEIIIYDTTKKTQENLNISDEIFTELKYPTIGKNGEIALYSRNKNKFYSIDLKQKNLASIKKSPIEGEIRDIKLYANSTIYSLDAKNNQIYTYKTSQGEPWLKEMDNDLHDAENFAIDGNIYILDSTGEINKFYKGEQVEFNISHFMPPIKDSAKIFTSADYKYLYILDPHNNRVVVLEKECKLSSKICSLIAQHTSPKFNNMNDFAVDENKKMIYILNNNAEIYHFNFK